MLEGLCSLRTLKFVGLAVGLAAKFTTGSIFIFNAYQDAIKHTFNYTQFEVELLSSMLNVGLGIGFLPGMIYDRFGPTTSSAAGLIVSVPVYLLIWSTTRYPTFYSTKAWLMSIYFLLAGLGSVFTYTVALHTNIINFPAKHTGKLVGFLNAFFAGSPSIFGTIYFKMFTTGDHTDPENQNFGGFMLFFAIMFGVVDLLCMIFLRKYVEHDETTTNIYLEVSPDNIEKEKDGGTLAENGNYVTENVEHAQSKEKEAGVDENEENGAMSIRRTLFNVDFELFVWMFAFSSSVSLVYGNNLTVTSRSVGLNYYNDKLVIIIPITNAIVSASIGLLSDYLKDRIPRLVLVIGGMSCFVVSQVLVILFANDYTWLVTATVFTGVGTGIIWSLCPTIMKEIFSMEHLGRNWGIALFVAALSAYAAQLVFGRLYDSHMTEGSDQHYCYGKDCIREGYELFMGVAILAVVLGLVLALKKKCCKKSN